MEKIDTVHQNLDGHINNIQQDISALYDFY